MYEEERMMILNMLQEEKISSEEAAKLLDALDESETKETNELINTAVNKTDNMSNKKNNTQQNSQSFEQKIESIVDKIENKTENLGSKMEKLGVDLAESTTSIAERIVDLVNNINFDGLTFGNYKTVTETLEKDISNIANPAFEFIGVNGKVSISSWNKNKVFVKATCQIKGNKLENLSEIYEIVENDDIISFRPKYNNLGAKLEVFVPQKEYRKINVLTTNGKIILEGINTKNILCDTTNSSIFLTNVKSQDINLFTKNGKISLQNAEGDNAVLSTSNNYILVERCNIKSIKATTSNGSIKGYSIPTNYSQYLELTTSNGKIDISFTDTKANFVVDAKTSMGNIKVGFPLIYEVNDQNNLGRKRITGYSKDNSDKYIRIKASTSNGSININ
ncbi:DUF4097 family beta strand repeat-containing protein [Caldisalinibacter kiritimatiensis]|uniref:Uncharacterized protein n=1 Tax=Caldisalinibacter kiritimatiensis TaxID=1304284 RepID=R1CMX5_9FIRM|nr:DUF4097 family beta strand repeat-containing protein [Caldisalinibacter kiritimatiensis]EOD00041.1 hypothetical protein L21TH_1930 [Caldisalinibacter kiritimatiensis]